MSDTNQAETFAERVDATMQSDGTFVGALEIEIRLGADHQEERVRKLQDECDRLRDRVAEFEGAAGRGPGVTTTEVSGQPSAPQT